MFQRIAFLKKYSKPFGRHCWWEPGFSKVTCNMWGPFKKRHSYNLQSPRIFYNKYVRYFRAPIFRTIPGKFVRIMSFTFIAKKDIWEVSSDSYQSYNFENIKNTHEGVLLWVKVTLLCACFSQYQTAQSITYTLREKCSNRELFLVRIFLYSESKRENTDQK